MAGSLQAAIELLNGEPASIICGYGDVGKGSAHSLRAYGARVVVTEIDHVFRCDTFFPPIDPALWQETARESHYSEANGYGFAYVTYTRKEPNT